KARGPEIDRIPPLRLDLDFLDTTGYAVLPVESDPLSIDCAATNGAPRPFEQLQVTQTLDERQAKDGRLVLEIKAVCQGLVPDLKQLSTLAIDGFDVSSVDDQGLSVSRFDPDSSEPVILSERLWSVTLVGTRNGPEAPRQFRFPELQIPVKEVLWQRYNDADLAAVEQTVALQQTYEKPGNNWAIAGMIGGVGLLVLGIIATIVLLRRQPETPSTGPLLHVPEQITPFTVLNYLKQIDGTNGMSDSRRGELQQWIARIERYYFAEERDADAPDLQQVVDDWSHRSR
ncbi:MAG: hypothetical protein KDA85_22905, partial [Planctomycetaceae bacterium]|nr:hypothetical protein [Planctomycetaceae bacterium]